MKNVSPRYLHWYHVYQISTSWVDGAKLVEYIYGKKVGNPRQIATKGFMTDFGRLISIK